MFYKVRSVTPCPDYELRVSFVNGETKSYRVAPLFHKWKPFETLRLTKGLFDQVQVDAGGYGISWNDDIDLSCNELYNNGIPVK